MHRGPGNESIAGAIQLLIMKAVYPLLVFLCCTFCVQAQKEDRVWAYGNASGIDFNTTPATFFTTSSENYHHYSGAGSASICDKEGRLLFYTNGTKVWDGSGAIMPGGILLSGFPMGPVSSEYGIFLLQQSAAIAADPSDRNRYYVFHTWRKMMANGDFLSDTCSLFYSVVDMSLNNGKGAVVSSMKKIKIDDQITGALTVVRGDNCNVWVITHSISGNTFKAYELTVNGLNTTPVLSQVGLPTPPPYYYDNNPYLFRWFETSVRVSPDRKKLVHTGNQGSDAFGNSGPSFLQLLDFNAATGQLQNPITLANLPENTRSVRDACFSPGSSKLYYAWNFPCIGCGSVSQFDLSLPTPAAIIASESYISGGTAVAYNIKTAPDGRIYIGKGYNFSGPYAPAMQGLYYIQQPELAGPACQFINNDLQFQSFDSRTGPFPNENAVLPRDTAAATHQIVACGKDTLWLTPDPPANHIQWWDGTSAAQKAITEPGTYILSYQQGCTDHLDTFVVRFQQLPVVTWDSATCKDPATASAYATPRDNSPVTFTWKKEQELLRSGESTAGDTIRGLSPGDYSVRMVTTTGCDTTIRFTIAPYPETLLTVTPENAKIKYGDSIQLQADGAIFYAWWPSGTVSNDTLPDPYVRPLKPTVYTVLGLNAYGCRNTARVNIDIDYQMPVFIPNAFSPNGDGTNDVFRLGNISYQKLAAFKIFNRWGQQLFETMDPNKGWDGTQQGKPCNTDTYYYLVIINYPDGASKTFKGDLTLIR